MMRSGNPALRAFEKPVSYDQLGAVPASLDEGRSRVMTIGGTVQVTSILLAITFAAALGGWMLVQRGMVPSMGLWAVGMLGGLGLALVIAFNPRTAPFLAPVYAILKGAFLGGISFVVAAMVDNQLGAEVAAGMITPGQILVLQAILLTMGVLGAMLLGYSTGLLRLGSTGKKIVMVATMGIMAYYLVAIVLSLVMPGTGVAALMSFNNGSPISIGFSLFVIAIASFNLLMDFELIHEGADSGQPKYMEWYGGFALLVTLVWLYFEILRLLAKLQSRD